VLGVPDDLFGLGDGFGEGLSEHKLLFENSF
jgi:hypothetical protein